MIGTHITRGELAQLIHFVSGKCGRHRGKYAARRVETLAEPVSRHTHTPAARHQHGKQSRTWVTRTSRNAEHLYGTINSYSLYGDHFLCPCLPLIYSGSAHCRFRLPLLMWPVLVVSYQRNASRRNKNNSASKCVHFNSVEKHALKNDRVDRSFYVIVIYVFVVSFHRIPCKRFVCLLWTLTLVIFLRAEPNEWVSSGGSNWAHFKSNNNNETATTTTTTHSYS